jgi:hypothetical protein
VTYVVVHLGGRGGRANKASVSSGAKRAILLSPTLSVFSSLNNPATPQREGK